MSEEAGDDAGLEGAFGGVFRVEEEGVSDAYMLNEAVNLFRCYGAGVCVEGLIYSVVFEEAQLKPALGVGEGFLSALKGFEDR